MSITKPNIVFILADDMGYGDFSAFNKDIATTPFLDDLMDQGVVLTQAYAASPVCNPSRASLLTGRYPHRTGSIDTLEWRGLERLALDEVTPADVLQASGYHTGLIGKWHLGAFDRRYHPQARGFSESVCFSGGMHDYYDWRLTYGDQVRRSDGTYLTDLWTQEACDFIERNSNQPFFLHVTYNAPHRPLQCPEDEWRPYWEKGNVTQAVAKIYGMLRRMDRGVERVWQALGKAGVQDNTIFIFGSDNGPEFSGEGDDDTTRFNCNYRGAKTKVYDGGIRVPMFVHWPAGLPRGTAFSGLFHFNDLLPTLLSAVGVDRNSLLASTSRADMEVDGIDMLGALRGHVGQWPVRYWQWNRYRPLVSCNAAMRDGKWKLVQPEIPEAMEVFDLHWLRVSMYEPEYFEEHGLVTPGFPERELSEPKPLELYDLSEDPFEERNLADIYPQRVANMKTELENWFDSMEADRTRGE